MAVTEVSICNNALLYLGSETIDSLADATDRARLCAALFEPTRDETLRAHRWNFAIKRVTSLSYQLPAATLTPGAGATVVNTTGVTFTASAAVFVAADVGRVIRASNGVGKATITGFTSTTVVTATIDTAFADLSAIASQAWKLDYTPPAHTYDFAHPKPSDWLRWLDTPADDLEPFKVEGQYLVSNSDELDLTYLAKITDPTLFDSLFVEALQTHLAMKLSYPITGTAAVWDRMAKMYQGKLMEARGIDGQEGSPDELLSDVLINVRR